MDKEELAQKMIEFVNAQDGEMCDEWYTTDRDIAEIFLGRFAEHIGLEVVIPNYIPVKTRTEVCIEKERTAIFREMLPELEKLFNLQYKAIAEKKLKEQNNA